MHIALSHEIQSLMQNLSLEWSVFQNLYNQLIIVRLLVTLWEETDVQFSLVLTGQLVDVMKLILLEWR